MCKNKCKVGINTQQNKQHSNVVTISKYNVLKCVGFYISIYINRYLQGNEADLLTGHAFVTAAGFQSELKPKAWQVLAGDSAAGRL